MVARGMPAKVATPATGGLAVMRRQTITAFASPMERCRALTVYQNTATNCVIPALRRARPEKR